MEKNSKIYFWLILALLIFGQYLFTANSLGQIRYEELAESVRNVYWLENHIIYDGVSSNIGWYGTMLAIYNIFGFSLNAAKYYRLVLSAVSLVCLGLTLKRFFGPRKAVVPLITLGLSPTLLYFNTLQTSYGMDLQYVPVILYLITSLDFSKTYSLFARQFLAGFLSMAAWMSYPTMVFYLPALFLLYLYQSFQAFKKKYRFRAAAGLLAAGFSFLLPLIIGFLFISDKQLLFYDKAVGSGIFRGAGNIHPDAGIFLFNVLHTFTDLASSANSYYFEVNVVDFSWLLPLLASLAALAAGLFFVRYDPKRRFIILLAWSVLLFNLFLGNLAFDPSGKPGLRRSTAFLASIYFFITLLWYYLLVVKRNFAGLRTALIVLLLTIFLHHLIAFPINLANLSAASPYKYGLGFGIVSGPGKSLDLMVSQVKQEDLKLACQNQDGKKVFCRYQEMYAAVAGECLWNRVKCHQILGYDPKTEKFIELSPRLWETYYWEH